MKGFATGLLNFILFSCLSALGLAITLNYTILNPEFVIAQVEKIDVSSLIKDELAGYIPQQFEFMSDTIDDTIDDLKPLMQEQVNNAVYSAHDYLTGKSSEFSIVISTDKITEGLRGNLREGILQLSQSELEELAPELLGQFSDQLYTQVTSGQIEPGSEIDSILRENLWEVFQQSLTPGLAGLSAELLEQSFDQFYSQIISGQIPSDFELDKSPEEYLDEAILQLPLSELSSLLPSFLDQHFDEFFDQTVGSMIPPTFAIDEDLIGPEAMGYLEKARQYFSYFGIAFKGLIGLVILLIAGIILINRQVRAGARRIGITFTTYGALGYGGILVLKYFGVQQLTRFVQVGLPAQVQECLPRVLNDITSPLQMFTLGALIAGVVLIVVSHVYKPQETSIES